MTFAYFCVFLTIFLPIFCSVYAKKKAGMGAEENHDPRRFLQQAEGAAARAHAAQNNSYEIFAPFAAAVIIAHLTGEAGQGAVNFWAGAFLISRIAYIYCYIADKALARSIIFCIGLLCIVALFAAAF